MTGNRRWVLRRHPEGRITPDDFISETVAEPAEPLAPGEIAVRNIAFSVAPTIRNRLNAGGIGQRAGIAIGEPVEGMALVEVMASAHPGYPPGTRLVAMSRWEDRSRLRPERSPVPPFGVPRAATAEQALGLQSPNALTAWFGMGELGAPRTGETVLVSGAAGSVGAIACQIARSAGARVIGIAGSDAKCRWLRDRAGVAATINYRSEALAERLAALATDGVDLFFDNVGGDQLQAAVDRMARHGRIVLCGQIASYDRVGGAPGPRDMMRVVYGALTIRGFVVGDFIGRADEGRAQLARLVDAGELIVRLDVRHGLGQLPRAFCDLFEGANDGTLIVVNG